MTVLIILNLITPTGRQLGVTRIEDITAGAAVAVLASLLLWPRGATATVYAVIDAAIDLGSRYLCAAVLRATRGASGDADDNAAALSHAALVAGRTVDDAVRHYLSETGNQVESSDPVIRAANRAVRLRIAADIVADITRPPALSAYPRARAVLEAHADLAWARLTSVSEHTWGPISDELVLALRADFTGDEATVNTALTLVTVAANLGEIELICPPRLGRGAALAAD
ncbi:MAG TPA: hypothetical protein VN888_24020 [Mycobacterium sp.]|nr:hypothetical protein [Mycobacterium sp.]